MNRRTSIPPGPLELAGTPSSLADVLAQVAAVAPDREILSRRAGDTWVGVSAKQFLAEVLDLARGLIASGVGPGDRVGLVSKTRYEWTLCDFAIWSAGAVTVPIYETSSAEQLAWNLGNAGAVACLLETRSHARLLDEVREHLPQLRSTWAIEPVAGLPGLAQLVADGREVDDATVAARRTALTPDSLATVIYTSGTTGRPRGCELTHGNFLAECHGAVQALPELFAPEDASTLLFLPLAHVFGRMIQVACVLTGTRIGHSDLARVTRDLPSFRPSFVLAVPRVFEKIHDTARRKAAADGKGRVFDLAAATAIAASRAQDRSRRPRPLLRARHAVFDRLVYSKLRAAFGGEVQWAISGGAALGPRLAHFFRGAGITVLEGYGLTETTAASTVNRPTNTRIGTVGVPLPGTEVRVADDGEILIRGGQVFAAYWRDEEATAAALTGDGWLRTGDLGRLDADGFLSITGRKKEILVTSGGKNVSPGPLEDAVRADPLVSQCMVVGDGRPNIAALVTLDHDALGAWLAERRRTAHGVGELVDDPEVIAQVQRAIDAANASVSRAEAIGKFRILPVDLTEDSGHLTPTLKLKRSVIMEDYADEIDALYGT